jgi:hypothetical protein
MALNRGLRGKGEKPENNEFHPILDHSFEDAREGEPLSRRTAGLSGRKTGMELVCSMFLFSRDNVRLSFCSH